MAKTQKRKKIPREELTEYGKVFINNKFKAITGKEAKEIIDSEEYNIPKNADSGTLYWKVKYMNAFYHDIPLGKQPAAKNPTKWGLISALSDLLAKNIIKRDRLFGDCYIVRTKPTEELINKYKKQEEETNRISDKLEELKERVHLPL